MVLRGVDTGRFVMVPATAVVGRDRSCAVVLGSDQVSARHAELRWQPGGWCVRDLGSRNGTAMDGARLVSGVSAAVEQGATLLFGDPAESWQVVCAGAPSVCLFDPSTGEVVLPVDGRAGPVEYDLERGGWYVDGRLVADGDQVDGRVWFSPQLESAVSTAPARVSLPLARLRIVASRDLVTFEIHVEDGSERVSFSGRAWGVALYVLALERLSDPNDGWLDVERLAVRSGLSRKVLDVYLIRARRAFVTAGIGAGESIVEVRPGGRRLGLRDVEVERAGA